MHVRKYIGQIISAGLQPTKQHFIIIFSALKEAEHDEIKLFIMKLYAEWRKGAGEGATITVLQLLAKADSEYKRLILLNQWTTKNKSSELLGLQAELKTLNHQFIALLADHVKLKNKETKPSTKPTSDPKPEENEERVVNGEKWYHCTKCMTGRQWNKTHKTSEHKRGAGKNRTRNTSALTINEQQPQGHTASYDIGFGADSDFQLGQDC